MRFEINLRINFLRLEVFVLQTKEFSGKMLVKLTPAFRAVNRILKTFWISTNYESTLWTLLDSISTTRKLFQKKLDRFAIENSFIYRQNDLALSKSRFEWMFYEPPPHRWRASGDRRGRRGSSWGWGRRWRRPRQELTRSPGCVGQQQGVCWKKNLGIRKWRKIYIIMLTDF